LLENALKLTYGNVEFKNFPGGPPDPPLQGEGEGGREEWKREGEGRGKRVRGGREGLKEREGKER
jgi:hypothetical protein